MAAPFCLRGPELVLTSHEGFPAWQMLSVFTRLSSTETCKRKYWLYGRDVSDFVCPKIGQIMSHVHTPGAQRFSQPSQQRSGALSATVGFIGHGWLAFLRRFVQQNRTVRPFSLASRSLIAPSRISFVLPWFQSP
jgi:hypothetical protein